ncbi:unnamed protein product [Aphanomyces euteiches]|uniref:Uncharacterized protein n=1 Tax=Aphanomyces euteiches TaxID=100861 RepID=A0A6G0X6S9_9STRA|nr:hypothetical protein Ae201684_007947 [Aphanomyces euteiches]KAH9074513.1 hypothetical protein Ae201684P_022320 [Aphanomyces euteiches]KAH9145419.1 hypothetical protein AeRB84_010679 [Aphanomyces euteiches]
MVAVECDFYLPQCSHQSLFQQSYVRCQKSQGQKILRCFPHCCPRHIHYRNCGCSLHLQVRASTMPQGLQAFAKFAPIDDDINDWRIGDTIPPATILNDARSHETPFQTWIPGRSEWIKATTASFHFDEKKGDGWHYGWKSGRSRTQRTSAHSIKAFVLDASWRVVAIAQSTPFTITSYRGEHNKRKRSAIAVAPSTHHLRLSLTTSSSAHSSSDEEGNSPLPVMPMPMHHGLARLFTLMHHLPINDCPWNVWAPFEAKWMAQRGLYSDRFFLPHKPTTSSTGQPSPLLAVVLQLVTSVADVADRIQCLLLRQGDAVLHKRDMLALYDECLLLIQTHVSRVVHDYKLKDLLTQVPPQHDENHLFHLFVAQMRETFIATQQDPPLLHPSGHSVFDGTWVWLPHETQYTHQWSLSLSILAYLRWTANMAAFDQTRRGNTLHIRACLPWFVSIPMTLELDQEPHSLRVLPTGESCMAGTLAIDYLGRITEQCVSLELYVYGTSSTHFVQMDIFPRHSQQHGIPQLVAHVHIDQIQTHARADEATDAATRVKMVRQIGSRTTLVSMRCVYEQRRRR